MTDFDQQFESSNLIHCPFVEQEEGEEGAFVPMVIMSDGMKTFIGGMAGTEDGESMLLHPLQYIEVPQQNGTIGVAMAKPWQGTGLSSHLYVRAARFSFLMQQEGDQALMKQYEEIITKARAAERGIYIAGLNEIPKGPAS